MNTTVVGELGIFGVHFPAFIPLAIPDNASALHLVPGAPGLSTSHDSAKPPRRHAFMPSKIGSTVASKHKHWLPALDPKPSANQLFYWALVKCHAHGIGGVSDSSTMESLDADP